MTGHDLRVRREDLGLSQRKLAALLGIHWNVLARWERGVLTIRHPRILELALDAVTASQQSDEKHEQI